MEARVNQSSNNSSGTKQMENSQNNNGESRDEQTLFQTATITIQYEDESKGEYPNVICTVVNEGEKETNDGLELNLMISNL